MIKNKRNMDVVGNLIWVTWQQYLFIQKRKWPVETIECNCYDGSDRILVSCPMWNFSMVNNKLGKLLNIETEMK